MVFVRLIDWPAGMHVDVPGATVADVVRAALVMLRVPEGTREENVLMADGRGHLQRSTAPVSGFPPGTVLTVLVQEAAPAAVAAPCQPGSCRPPREVHRSGVRRLMHELRQARQEPSWGIAAAPVREDDLFKWHCNVAGRPPQGGKPVVLHLELSFTEDYPVRPPKVEVLGSEVRHPNVFSTFICLDMLEGGEWADEKERMRPYSGWSSAYGVLAVLRQLQTFFFEGDGTRWWACPVCTLHNPIKSTRCEACGKVRGHVAEIGINVTHKPDFRCVCGHTHTGPEHPPFPDPIDCDDAPTSAPPPEGLPDDCCAICLGSLMEEAFRRGPLRGTTGAPLARLCDVEGKAVCDHWFHTPCAEGLQVSLCPLCRAPFKRAVSRARTPPSTPTVRVPRGQCPPVHPMHKRVPRLYRLPRAAVLSIMSCLRAPQRSALVAAAPIWRNVAAAPEFWEAQELQCFHEKIGPDEDTIGVGVLAEGRGKLATLAVSFDALSLTAWNGGLRRAAWKEPLTHWLPLYVSADHAHRARDLLLERVREIAALGREREDEGPYGPDAHLPPRIFMELRRRGAPPSATDAVLVIPEMMHQLMKQVVHGDRHASLKLLKGYFVLHRLFLHCCDLFPAIREAVDETLKEFMSSAEYRSKERAPWLAYILQLVTVSNIGWEEIGDTYLEECYARNAQFTLKRHPHYRPLDPDAGRQAAAGPCKQSAWASSDGAVEVAPGVWRGRGTGWSMLLGRESNQSRKIFGIRVRSETRDSVVRVGFVQPGGSLCGSCDNGFGFYAGRCFGRRAYTMHNGSISRAGRAFVEGSMVTCVVESDGSINFAVNAKPARSSWSYVHGSEGLVPCIALKQGAEVEILPEGSEPVHELTTPEQHRDMAFDANRLGCKLLMFQAFFLRLVRPGKLRDGTPDWDTLKREYDARFGFPPPVKADALLAHFAEVHRVAGRRGREAWPQFLRLVGCSAGGDTAHAIDRALFAGYTRAVQLGYKTGGRHDHA
eukprot:TRINITY_DN35458_c0_g1_i1.p1 TRINITY_DN35458_c0_g1~~TRINITY_DN35458_c0_g1_i1.p1  ORF type:complete len:994 (+),score=247.37 TRINITY_DN35458_c0_g1_i1:72-3053(+)